MRSFRFAEEVLKGEGDSFFSAFCLIPEGYQRLNLARKAYKFVTGLMQVQSI